VFWCGCPLSEEVCSSKGVRLCAGKQGTCIDIPSGITGAADITTSQAPIRDQPLARGLATLLEGLGARIHPKVVKLLWAHN